MKNIRHILVLLISFTLSISMAEAGIVTNQITTSEFCETETIEAEEQYALSTSEDVDDVKNSIDGGDDLVDDKISDLLQIQTPPHALIFGSSSEISFPLELGVFSQTELFILYCCLKLNF